MKINQLITLLFISLICVIGIKSQETCENYNNQIVEVSVVPRYIGVVETLKITNAVSMTYSTNLGQYFSAELVTDQNEIRLSTTESFANYEKDNNVTRTVLNLNIRCSSSNTNLEFRITISSVNNYPPEFTASNYEIKIPTPLAKGAELTSYLEFDDQILATDYDLYDNSLSFTLTGSDLFYVESVDITGIKSTFKARIFTNQQIIKLENDIVELTLTATDSSNEPKSSSVKVNIFTDPENTFIESPKFSKPLYRGNLEKGKTLEIEGIQLDESTYDDNVRLEIAGDLYGIINMTSDGPAVKITLNEGNLPDEVFKQKFIDFVIEAKRDGDNSGFAVVIIDVSLPIFTFNFEKSLYEGELKEKGRALSIQGMKLSTNGSLETTSLSLSQVDAKYFDLNINADIVSIKLKEEAPINEIMTKTLLFVTIEAIQNNTVIASTNVIIKTVAILVPQFENNFYRAIIENGDLKHEGIFIIEDSISLDEEIEVSLIGTERLIFDVELTEREISLKLKTGAEIPKNKSFLTLQIQVNVKSSTKKNTAVMICELEFTSNPQEFLQFNSQLYEGKISQDLVLSSPDIILNTVENVNITLSGKHGSYFEQDFNENQLGLKLKDGVVIEQFSTDFYIQITIEASRENFTSATSNVIFGIQRNLITDSTFEKSLYIGKIDGQKELKLENLIIKSDNLFTNVRLAGDDAEFFNANVYNNVITLQLFKNITEDLLLKKTILYAKIVAEFEDSSIATNVIVTLPRPDEIKTLAFETSHTSGTIRKDELLNLEIGEFYLHPFNYDETVQFNLTGTDAHLFNLDQNLNKIQLKMNQGINEEQLNSKKFILLSVIATKEEFVKAEHFIFINVEIFNSSESMFEKTLYVGTVDEQRELQIEKLIIKSDYEFSSIEFIGDDTEYFEALIEQNQIIIRLFKNITEDLLIQKSILSTKVIAQYDDILISTNIIVKLPRPDQIKKLKFETTYTSGTIRKDTELVLELNEFSLNPANYDEKVQFNLTGTDAHLFNLDQNLNKIQIRLKQDLGEEQLNSKKFISLSVIATKEEFEKAEHFIFINVEIFNSSESMFEKTLYVGTVDEQRELQIEKLIIKSDYEFSSIEFIGDDTEYFEALIEQNQIIIRLFKNITEDLLIQKSILSTKVIAQYDDILISTNLIVTLPRPDEIQSLKFETSYSTGKIVTHPELSFELDEISLQTGNYDDDVKFNLDGADADLFDIVRNAYKIQLKLKSETNSEMLIEKEVLSLIILATRENYVSAEHFVAIYIEKSSTLASDSFDKSLYIGNINEQKELDVEKMVIKSDQVFNTVEMIGDDSELFEASVKQNSVTVRLKEAIAKITLSQKSLLRAQIVAKHDDISIYTNLVVELPQIDEEQRLSFETPYTVGNLEIYPQAKLSIQEIVLGLANYDDSVQFNLTGSDAILFELVRIGNIIQPKIKSEINEDSLENKEYFTLTLKATKQGFESAEHFIFVNILTPEIDESSFDQNLFVGSINNQRVLLLDPLLIKSERIFDEVIVADDDFEYFVASVDQNYVTITLAKEITEDLLLKTSLLSTKIIAKSGDITISSNIIVTLPKVNGDKILRFESPYYVGTLDQLELDIENVVLEINNYDETVEFVLIGSDKDLFKIEKDQNLIKLSLANDVTQEDLQNRVFLTASITATRNEFATAETVIFVHLNVIVDEISPIEFDKVIYSGSLTFNNVLVLDRISLKSNETEIQISHKGDHADKFTINDSNLKDIHFNFIPQPLDFTSKFYHFYIEALKFGAPKAYAAVIIQIVDKIQLKFDEVNYFGSIDEKEILIMDQIPINSEMANSEVSFRLVDGHNEFFGLNSTESAIQITKTMSIAVENLSFVWFYLEAYGSNYYHARTLIVVDFPQKIDTPIDECYDKLDPTQPYFETGSYSFTIMSDETGLAGQIHAIITDPEDSIVSYELLFENIFLYDKITADGGDIKLLVQIPAGFYRMKGIALSMNSNKSAETSILLRVLEPKTCEDGKPITTVQKTLAVVKIEENEIHDQIMYMTIGDCHYEIIKVVPDVLKDSLTIDSKTRYLKNIIPFDREDAVFANYSVPQLQVTLHLICPTTYLSLSDDQRIQPYMNEVFTDEILYSPSITYLNLEILDQNDNSPIFINPSNVNFRVAFPDENLIGLFMPNYLFKVEAYDIDDGINAIIRYSTSMPSIFEINTVTGEIYPLRTLPDEPTGFLITATDRAGAGLRTTTSIDFKKISSANVIEIIADNFAIKDIDRLALELSEKLEADFRVLSSSQLPFTTNSQVLRFADTQAKTKIYGYAFKTNSLDLFTPAELIEQLKELELSFPINYSAVDGCAQEKNDDDECDLTIWIFVVSFMGTVLLLILISIPIFWYFYLKKRLQNNDSNSNSSKEEIANRFYDNDSVRDSEIASEIVEAITELRTSDAQIMGVGVDGVTEDESSSDPEKLSHKLMSILEPSSPIHDRKVKFNEMVERIEVINDHDPDTDDIPHHKRY